MITNLHDLSLGVMCIKTSKVTLEKSVNVPVYKVYKLAGKCIVSSWKNLVIVPSVEFYIQLDN